MRIQPPDFSRGGLFDFARGFFLPFRALRLIFTTRQLAFLTLAVAAVTLACLVGLAILLWWLAPAATDWIWQTRSTSWWAVSLHHLVTVFVFLVLFAVGANVLPGTLTAPLMDPISAHTERLMGFESEEGGLGRTLKETARSIANGLFRAAILIIGQILLLPLLLIPVAGAPAWSALSWVWTALWASISFLDVPMARHLFNFKQEATILRKRFGLCLGFGGAVSLMLWVPLLNFFFVPVAVVGATLLFRGLVAARVLPQLVRTDAS